MTIINNSKNTYSLQWKGFHYGKSSVFDQIAAGFGKTSSGHCTKSSLDILRPAFTTRFHAGSIVCYPHNEAILQDRLSRYRRNTTGLIKHSESFRSKQTATLYNFAKSSAKAAKKNIFEGLLGKIFDLARAIGLIDKQPEASIDSTGLENHFVSRHFIMRQKGRTTRYRRWTKLTIVGHNSSHLLAGASVSIGPSTDCHCLADAAAEAVNNLPIKVLLADSGYDSEYNHELCRNQLGIRQTVIAINDRNRKYSPMTGYFRKQMKQRFPKKKYRQRWQIESIFSRFKRRLGYALTARSNQSRSVECLLRVLTYNLMIVYLLFKKSYILVISTEQNDIIRFG